MKHFYADKVGASAPTNDDAPDRDRGRGVKSELNEDFRTAIRSGAKRLIVLAACWGFPAAWAHWLIERGGLAND